MHLSLLKEQSLLKCQIEERWIKVTETFGKATEKKDWALEVKIHKE